MLPLEQHMDCPAVTNIMTKTQPCLAKSLTGNHITAADVYPRYTTVVLDSGDTKYFTFFCHFRVGLCGTYWLCSTTQQDAAFSGFGY